MVGARIGRSEYGALFAAFGLALVLGFHTGTSGNAGDLKLLVGLLCFATVVLLTMAAPHILVAIVIPIFALIPFLKVFLFPWIGPLKDAVIVAAVVGTALVALHRGQSGRRHRADGLLLVLVGAFLSLYVLNVGAGFAAGAYGGQWQQSVRLTAGPLLLLTVGLMARRPAQVFRWSLVSFVATSCGVALYGLYQQQIGKWGLVGMGYEFDVNVRTINGHLRSFGTLDDPFAYAAFLLFGLAVLMFLRLNRWLAASIATILIVGLAASYVRTAVVVLVALFSVWLASRGQPAVALLLLGGAVAASVVLLAGQSATQTRTVQAAPSTFLSINGRTEVWKDVLDKKSQWPFGKGVGAVGTAADRAKFGVYRTREGADREATTAVDSGYLATVADVGFVGLAIFLAILGRLSQLCYRYARRGITAGWIGGSLLIVLMLDAVTRASFIGFPTAFLGLLLVGIAINAASSGDADMAAP